MTPSFKKLWLAAAMAVLMLAIAGCNDTLRQFIIPITKPTGDSGPLAHAIVLSANPPSGNGSTLHIDVSGDTIVGQVTVGPNPVFFGIASNRVFVINGDNTITSYIALLPTTPPFSTVTLPTSGSDAATTPIAGGNSNNGNFYTTNSGSNNSSIVSSTVLSETGTITVGTHPVAIAGNAANSKIYVVNQGSNNVTVVSTSDNTVIKTIPVGSSPIWAVMAANGVQVFVVNQGDGTVSVIDTTLDAVIPCADGPGVTNCPSPFTAITVGASPNFAFYDVNRQRLYVSNTGTNKVSVIKADGIDLGPPRVLPRWLADVTVASAPVSVAALPDGSKVYAALGGCPAGTNHTNLVSPDATTGNIASCNGNQVSVIDANSLVQTRTITVGPGAVSVATASDSLRAYVVSAHDTSTIIDNVHAPNCTSNCKPGSVQPPRTFFTPSVYDIKTSTDTIIPRTTDPTVTSSPIPTFLAPPQDPTCVPGIDVNFNSSTPVLCTGQIAFMVRTFP
jgi:YVTN family beta-propeller protein